jgi:RNA polymerase sigma factor for flagellar operon FliA
MVFSLTRSGPSKSPSKKIAVSQLAKQGGLQMLPSNAATYSRGTYAEGGLSSLIESHLSYAQAIAAGVARKLPPEVDRKDIQSWAKLGLVEAASAFDRTRGVQFKTFAYYRIKGAIYDGLRKMGWYPKGQYQQMRFEMNANEYFKDLSANPLPSGSAEAQLQDLKDLTGNLMSCYMLSLEALPCEPVDQPEVGIEEAVMRSQQRENLRHALSQLPERNRRILEHCYFEGLTFEQIGQKLGLSKSWVCRLHSKSLEMLREQLEKTARHPGNKAATFSAPIR